VSLQVHVRWQRGDFLLHCAHTLPADGVTALFGRSGCGKTSLLRIIAGLDKVAAAQLRFSDKIWQQGKHFVPPEKRRIGLVFQEHSLLPHLSVKGNLLYGWQRTPVAQRRLQPGAVISMLEIDELLCRSVDQLSGGQRQRVALGRALLSSPQLLLLDEPMAALDSQAKREILPFLSRLARDTDVPMLLVTHAPDEVQRLADTVAFMRDGSISEICSLQQAMAKPDSPLFADEGPASVLEGALGEADEHGFCAFGAVGSQLFVQASEATDVDRTRIRVLARDVSVALDNPSRISIQNHLEVRIRHMHQLENGHMLLSTELRDGQVLLVEITQRAMQQLSLQTDQTVWALIKSVAIVQ
jgi:molybdate transport system ATP-binding protein